MKIVDASLIHLNELAMLFDSYRIFYRKPSDVAGAISFLKGRIERNESTIYIAVDENDEVLGFALLYPRFSSLRMKPIWLLNDLFVHADHRGKGISKLLIERCKALVMQTEAAGLSLETEKSNYIANLLYPEVGFELISDHNFYFWRNPNQ